MGLGFLSVFMFVCMLIYLFYLRVLAKDEKPPYEVKKSWTSIEVGAHIFVSLSAEGKGGGGGGDGAVEGSQALPFQDAFVTLYVISLR